MVPRDGAATPHQRLALFLVVLMSLSVLPLVPQQFLLTARGMRQSQLLQFLMLWKLIRANQANTSFVFEIQGQIR